MVQFSCVSMFPLCSLEMAARFHGTSLAIFNHVIHDDVIKWKHFPRYWPVVRGIHRSRDNFPHKGQWRGALVFSLICALNKRLSKQLWSWWFETPSRSLWRHCNVTSKTIRKLLMAKETWKKTCPISESTLCLLSARHLRGNYDQFLVAYIHIAYIERERERSGNLITYDAICTSIIAINSNPSISTHSWVTVNACSGVTY